MTGFAFTKDEKVLLDHLAIYAGVGLSEASRAAATFVNLVARMKLIIESHAEEKTDADPKA